MKHSTRWVSILGVAVLAASLATSHAFAYPTATTHTLTVRPEPADARIRIMNIKPRYRSGMELEPGRYHVEVSKAGYEEMRQWVDVNGDVTLPIRLKKADPIGDKWTDPITGMEFVWVPKGCFKMGSENSDAYNDEKPVHEACVDGFWMGKTEVTQRQWRKAMENNPSYFKGDDRPVEKISWNDTQEFMEKLTAHSGGHYRLPTEAEWEYACRSGGKDQEYCGGDNPDRLAWYAKNARGETHPVAQKSANGLGLYDMSGNVWEWIQDQWHDNYEGAPADGAWEGLETGAFRVNRGGSWNSFAPFVRVPFRLGYRPGGRSNALGFRCVRVHEPGR
uniref:Formylglycine-generating enzyme, required for sulfatase activity, contains SUMF1/FGE domain n=1 Tax=Candidatus Kentrum sp. TUN TaxID=2126343 RepID=A0A450ZY47_9GAMM|nr:MAG: Formylglycine-generating enzyme, required for sulfatase activity, contains SUMF1/FGE domain [Candidatus Kentron sp. TUN]